MSHNSLSYSPLTHLPNVLITPSVTKLLNCFQIKNVISVNLALITAINKTMQSRRYAKIHMTRQFSRPAAPRVTF